MMCSDTFQKVVQLRHFVEPASYYTMHLAYFGCGHLILTFSYDLQASITIWPFLYTDPPQKRLDRHGSGSALCAHIYIRRASPWLLA